MRRRRRRARSGSIRAAPSAVAAGRRNGGRGYEEDSEELRQAIIGRKEKEYVERRIINPWTWQDQLGYVQANEVSGAQRTLFCSGQVAMDAEGRPTHPDDMRAQIVQAMDNLETVLKDAGFGLPDVVRLNYYTTDVDRFFEAYDALAARLAETGCRPAATLLGVARLALPELLVEIEATAVA
jgi:enamine deaminase RidA (YjgF/YER057c/UK114 family)